MASITGSFSLFIWRTATAGLLSLALSIPANAQFWGDSWGGRQQRQQPYNGFGDSWGGRQQRQQPYNGFGDSWGGRQQRQQPYNAYGGGRDDRPSGYWGYRQRERLPSPRLRERERVREVEKEQPPDYSHAPPATPGKDATVKVVVMGDANADWLAYGLEEAFSDDPEIGVVRKHRTDSGLVRYDPRRDSEWPQVAREILAAEKPDLVVMMIGNNDRQTIREKAPPAAPVNAVPEQPTEAGAAKPPDLERQPAERQHPKVPPAHARQEAHGPWEFRSEKWEQAYVKRIAATIAALKSGGVPIIWVGLPAQRSTDASADSSYLNELYRSEAEKEGIAYADIWGGFVDEAGNFSPRGPDYLGQTRRLRSSDGVYFTKFGARKLAHYVEREIERIVGNKSMPVALPLPAAADPQAPKRKADGPAPRPAAGPVVPLTQAHIAPEELLGGDPSPDAAVAGGSIVKGGLLAAPSGRADDFSWPRGMINLEPAAVEPLAADTAARGAGVKSTKPVQRKSAMDAYAAQTGREQKPAQRRARPRLTPSPLAERPNVSVFESSGGW
jgi:uncharacterized protein